LELNFEANEEITVEKLNDLKIARNKNMPIKLLSNGSVTKKFTVKINAASQSAIKQIEEAGGSVEVI
jgi:large subunit ribosomal protein L15